MPSKIILISFLVSIAAASAALAFSTFDKNPTDKRSDRRASTDAAVKTAQLTQELLNEAKKTNKLLEELIKARASSPPITR